MTSKADIVRELLAKKAGRIGRPVNIMEVCGSHSFAIAKAGIRDLLPEGVKLLSGPGCPVCVSNEDFISRAITLCRRGIKVAVFGDLMRIPSALGTLGDEDGLMTIYSPEEVLDFAAENRDVETVFAAVGFEPTLSASAAVLERAEKEGLDNFSMLCDFKNIRPVLDMLASDPEAAIDGFLLPGHVASVIGEKGFSGLALPGVISGFTPENIILSIGILLDAISNGKPLIINNYTLSVRPEGSTGALELIHKFFSPVRGEWRGLGVIDGGNWAIRGEHAIFDAMKKYSLDTLTLPRENSKGCRCGEVLRGRLSPADCGLFAGACSPGHPVGACMVSTEGACAAAFHYRKG